MGRAPVSKTGGWGFDPLRSCQIRDNMISTFKFIQGVKNEAFKISWPTGRETLTGAVMVVLLAIVAAIFFLILDQILKFFLNFALTINF